MWLFEPAKRRAFPIPAPGQVGGWGRKSAGFLSPSLPGKGGVWWGEGCFWVFFKASVEGALGTE